MPRSLLPVADCPAYPIDERDPASGAPYRVVQRGADSARAVVSAVAVNRWWLPYVAGVMKRFAPLAGAAAAAMVLAACGSSGGGNSAPTKAAAAPPVSSVGATGSVSGGSGPVAPAGITISGFAYAGTLTVKAGAKITVTNQDSAAHTLTDKKTKTFDTGNIPANGGTATFTAPGTPGSYPFGCTYHPDMAGTLIVTS